ncbi:FecR family protein [Dyadobacter sp. CY323]|uniref:FecR family protein n=1 Tax=Dyadobacter sp. CY323 TaxID=2907302 RepID=UPI001F17831A|nr:FecR family protein [Dyadobacter sp. CY323]MCE6991093.1 FecR family protein [Dyadobacter sp. CY323]
MQQPYQSYSASDFVCDDHFLAHQLSPTDESEQFWHDWRIQNPSREQHYHQAQQLLEAVRLGLSDYARNYLSEEAEARLFDRIHSSKSQIKSGQPGFKITRNPWFLRGIAACLIFVLALGAWQLKDKWMQPSLYKQQVTNLPVPAIEKINDKSAPELTTLPDGSTVELFPGSRLSYPTDFGKTNRTVYLLGKARFDVRKNPQKPFYVYSNELVTKVLGTVFSVEAFEKDNALKIVVEHGQVSVYQQKNPDTKSARTILQGVLLKPNQQVVFSRESKQFSKTVVAEPALVDDRIVDKNSFVFEETPVIAVFELLKKAYGLDIIYNEEILKGCQLTASLADEPVLKKLDIITQSIGSSYEMVEGQVIIVSNGCKSP